MKCGVCGDNYGDLLLKHGERCEDDRKAQALPHSPEIDDLIRSCEESQ